MSNTEIVRQFIDNLFLDNEKAYEVVDENMETSWPGFGMDPIKGKANLKEFFESGGPEKVLSQELNNLIENGNLVVGDGSIRTVMNGKEYLNHFADFYTVENGKIVRLVSYMVSDQSNPPME